MPVRFQTPWLPHAIAAAVALACSLAFLPALTAGFSNFDDPAILLDTTAYRELSPESLRWMFTTTAMGHYQPVTWLSYAAEYQLWGLNAAGYHATNLILHAINVALVFHLSLSMLRAARPSWSSFRSISAAAMGAMLFGVHPLRVESVAWLTERRDLLSTCFLLLAALAYLRAFPPGSSAPVSKPAWAASVALLLLSLLSKAWGMTLFATLLVLDWYPLWRLPGSPRFWLSKPGRRVLLQKIPYAALGLLFAIQAGRAQGSMTATVKTLAEWGWAARVCQGAYGLTFYLWKTVIPTGLAALYELPARFEPRDPRWIAGGVFVLTAMVIVVSLRCRAPALLACALVYAITIAPVLGILQSGIQLVADRYSYIATMPWAILAGAAGASLLSRTPRLVPGAAAAAVLALGVLTWRQTLLWRDTEMLFASALARGHDGPITRAFYARQLAQRGRFSEAVSEFDRAIALDPKYGEPWLGRAGALKDLSRFAEAEESYRQSAALMPDSWRADLALGMMYIERLDRPRDAESCFRSAIAKVEAPHAPSFSPRPYLMLAAALDLQGDEKGARQWLQKAAQYPETRAEALRVLRDMDQP